MSKAAVETTIGAAGDTVLGDASRECASWWVIQGISDSFSGSIAIQGVVVGGDPDDAIAVSYIDMEDGDNKEAALTGSFLVKVDATGLDIVLATTYTSGAMGIRAHPLRD